LFFCVQKISTITILPSNQIKDYHHTVIDLNEMKVKTVMH